MMFFSNDVGEKYGGNGWGFDTNVFPRLSGCSRSERRTLRSFVLIISPITHGANLQIAVSDTGHR